MTAVVVEALAIVVLGGTGWLLGSRGDGTAWRLAAALPLGVAMQAVVAMLLLTVPLSVARPWVALVGALAVAVGVAARRRGAGAGPTAAADPIDGAVLSPARAGVISAALLAVTVLVTAWMPLVNMTSDSFRYLTVARLLATDGDASNMSAFLLQTRSLVTGSLHGLAAADPGYLRAVGPLLAISCCAMLGLLVHRSTTTLTTATGRLVTVGAIALLATNHRFLYNALYVNGHLVLAAWLLLLVGVAWRRATVATTATEAGASSVDADLLSAALAAAGIILVRPEGVLLVLLVLVPVTVTPTVPLWWRRGVLLAAGATTIVWHVGILMPLVVRDAYPQPVSITGLAGLGVATLLLGAALPMVDRVAGAWVLPATHATLWLAVLALTPGNLPILRASVGSTMRNVSSEGGWGVSLLLLAGLLVVTVAAVRVRHEQLWVFPLVAFIPLSLLLPLLRGGPYRVGPGDSLNRMLLHVLPLAVFALAATAAGTPRRWAWRPWASGRDREEHDGAVVAGADRHG